MASTPGEDAIIRCADAMGRQLQAEIERLRAALKPLVQARGSIEVGDLPGALSVITLGDLRRAAQAFDNEQSKDAKP